MSFHAGSPMLGSDIRLEGFGEAMEQSTTPEEEEAMLLEAVNAAKEADVVVLAIGEDRLRSRRGNQQREHPYGKSTETAWKRVQSQVKNVIVSLFNGRPLDLRDVVSKAKAVLEVWMPVPRCNAIADVVFRLHTLQASADLGFPYSVARCRFTTTVFHRKTHGAGQLQRPFPFNTSTSRTHHCSPFRIWHSSTPALQFQM